MSEYDSKSAEYIKTSKNLEEQYTRDVQTQKALDTQIAEASQAEVDALKRRTKSAVNSFPTVCQFCTSVNIQGTSANKQNDPE